MGSNPTASAKIMKTIYLIRHGQKEKRLDPSLTDVGIKQAIQTGKYLNRFPISNIIASPIKRTVQTADQVAAALKLNYTKDKRLVERMLRSEKIKGEDFIKEWLKASNNRNYLPKYGDSSINTGKRVEEVISELPANSHTLLVTHGGSILDYFRNIFGDKKLALLAINYNFGKDYRMNNCSINIVEIDKKPNLKLLNYTDHLEVVSE